MENVKVLVEKTFNLSKKTCLSNYDHDKPSRNIALSDTLNNNPTIKNFVKSKSESDLDDIDVVEETWGWFVDPKDILYKE